MDNMQENNGVTPVNQEVVVQNNEATPVESSIPTDMTTPTPSVAPVNAAQPETKKNNTPIIIIVIVVVALLVVAGIYLIVSGNKGEDKSSNKTTTTTTISAEELKSNIKYEEVGRNVKHYSYSDETPTKVLYKVTNNNKATVDISFNFVFYDELDNIISADDETELNVVGGQTRYFYVYLSDGFSKVDVSYSAQTTYLFDQDLKDYTKDLEVTGDVSNNKLFIQVKNKGEDTLSATVYAIFYKDNQVFDFKDEYASRLEANGNKTIEIDLPKDDNYEYAEYDRYEIVITNPYTYS